MLRKESPITFTLASGRPPYNGKEGRFMHPFLEGYQDVPFRSEVRDFDLVNAWWLAEIATFVYRDRHDVEDQLRAKGLVLARWFDSPTSGTESCIIRSIDSSFWVVAFRGTESSGTFSNIIKDILTDFKFNLVDWPNGGKVHSGFKQAFESVWGTHNGMQSFLKQECVDRHRVWFTGHSLGAALAVLAAQSFGPDGAGLYTFGSPNIGNREFIKCLFPPAFRFANHRDVVCNLPPGYCNVGYYKHFNELGVIDDSIIHRERMFSRLSFEQMFSWLPLPDFINDHVPVYYCNHIWNNLL